MPDAFLRRCVYYNIPFPDRDRLQEIHDKLDGEYSTPSDSMLIVPLGGLGSAVGIAVLMGEHDRYWDVAWLEKPL